MGLRQFRSFDKAPVCDGRTGEGPLVDLEKRTTDLAHHLSHPPKNHAHPLRARPITIQGTVGSHSLLSPSPLLSAGGNGKAAHRPGLQSCWRGGSRFCLRPAGPRFFFFFFCPCRSRCLARERRLPDALLSPCRTRQGPGARVRFQVQAR